MLQNGVIYKLSYFKNQATYTLVTQNKMYNFKILKMKKLLVLFLFVGFVCNTHALNKVISNSVNDTEQIVFPVNTQEVTPSVADFNCDIQNVAVYLSMEKISCDYLEKTFAIGSDGLYYGDKMVVKANSKYSNFTIYYKCNSIKKVKICKTKYIDVLEIINNELISKLEPEQGGVWDIIWVSRNDIDKFPY